MSQPDYADAGFVIASSYRTEIVFDLVDQPATPSTIATNTGHGIAHVSRSLADLREEGLVELLVPEERRKGRIYGLTDRGEEVASVIEEMEGEG